MTEELFEELFAIFEQACAEWDACQAAYLAGDTPEFKKRADAHRQLGALYRATRERDGATLN